METGTATADVIDQLRQGIATLTSTEQWARWLRVQRRFHHYSWGNSLLILMQRPDATRVAGYHTWTSVGRQVRKGERGIAILAPIVHRIHVEDEREDGTESVLVGHPKAFRLARVFDIAQTEGQALPEVVSRLTGDDPPRGLLDSSQSLLLSDTPSRSPNCPASATVTVPST